MTDRIKAILSEYSGVKADKMNDDTELVSGLGLSSLDIINIVVAFEDEFGIEIPNSDIKGFRTVGDVVDYLGKLNVDY